MIKQVVSALLLVALASGCAKPQESEHPDVQVLENMRKHGSDLSKPHPLDFYLYFPEEQGARTAAAALQLAQYEILRVEPGESGRNWLVLAQKVMVPARERVISTTNQLEKLAVDHGGEFDGWEAPILR